MSFGHATAPERARAGAAVLAVLRRLPAGIRLALALAGIWALLAVVSLSSGALVLSRHEGDAMHLAAMVLRMAEGQVPHLDYMTPIGILAVAPIAWLVSLGAGIGMAFVWSQVLLAAVLLPATWHAASSRFGFGAAGLGFGALVIGVAMAFVHGGTAEAVSISMHYNRWAWAVAFVVIALILLPPRGPARPWLEGVILGSALAALALTKVTYAVGLLPAVVLALAVRRLWATLVIGIGTGICCLAVVTGFLGVAFWTAYVGDLLDVATASSRPVPGRSLADVLVAPDYLAGTLAALAAIVVLRGAGRANEGLILMALLPGLVLITWQNFGNDPQWLAVVGLALLVLRPADGGGTHLVVLAAVSLALSAGWIVNLAASPMRVAAAEVAQSGPLIPGADLHADLRLVQKRLDTVTEERPMAGFGPPAEAPPWGAPLPQCDLVSGGVRVFTATARELELAGFAGRRLLVADTFQSFWLFGDFPPLPGGAPWYYGGLPGGGAAELIVVPLCPISAKGRDRLFDAASEAGWTLREVFRGSHSAVLEIVREE